jgi:acetylornithine deacetylase
MELFELAKALINIESVTGHERACAEFLHGYLVARNFEVEFQPVSRDRSNVFAKKGRPEVVLSTHIDTVPPFFLAHEDEQYIHGRGSCDAKGILAAQIVAAERLLGQGLTDFGLLFLVGEETTSDGAREANLHPPGSRYIINGEPTENKLVVGSKGNLRLDLRFHGKMAHSAYPHLGESAIDKLLDVLLDLRKLPLPHDPLLGPATLNIGVISGGRAANVVPDQAAAQVLIRTVSGTEELRRMISEVIAGRCELEFVRDTPPLRMEKVDGYETDVVAFTTDLPALTRWGRPVLLGPGSISVAHTQHEHVAKVELVKAVDLYCRLVRELKQAVESQESRVDTPQTVESQESRVGTPQTVDSGEPRVES